MKQDRGFVLVNALVLVAAMAAVAVFLLSRSETARVRLEQGQSRAQIGYYLDAFDALAITLLDSVSGPVDHGGEAWAKADFNVPVDRGQIAGQVTDMQGLFNLNWLTDPSNTRAQPAFDQLLLRAGISPQTGAAVTAFLRSGGPQSRQAYTRLDPPLDPVGGAILMFEQLRDIPQLRASDLEKLRRVATALPGESALNINTTSDQILAGFFPELTPTLIARLLSVRDREPFASTAEFIAAVENALGEGLGDDFDASRFSVGSEWFRVDSTAQLNNHTAKRTAVLFRAPFPIGTSVRWHTTTRP
jgi:general secretion pathway protein K